MENQIEEIACKNCIHYQLCVHLFRKAKQLNLTVPFEEGAFFADASDCGFYEDNRIYRKQSEGEWKYPPYAPFGGSYEMKRCSVCGYKPDFESDNPYTKFCHNCGAKMKGAEDGKQD